VREAVDLEAVRAVSTPKELATISRVIAAVEPLPEATPYIRQLVGGLTQIDLSREPLTAQQAAQWKEGLKQLVQEGSAAVPGIAEFLVRNTDLDFRGGDGLGYPSMRAAMLDALEQIGGPESQGLMLQVLQKTAAPPEIARLAAYLEQQAPGQFREQIASAVRETLAQADRGELRGWDVGPLFQTLQTYGGSDTIGDLENSVSKWNHYSVMALANLPSGEGIPSLIRLAQESKGSASGAAMEALGQVALHSADATAAMVELARAGKFSDYYWLSTVSSLGGEQYFISNTGLQNQTIPSGSGVKSYHLEASNQNFYSVPAVGGMSPEQINERVSIIDQLIAVQQSPAIAEALQNTRASLLRNGQQASAN